PLDLPSFPTRRSSDLLLNQFFSYVEPDIEGFDEAVEEFKERVPELARGLVAKIQEAHKDNPRFRAAFEKFFELCRSALNPNIRIDRKSTRLNSSHVSI